ncbi:H110 protein, partial [Eubucco bourcierii]|nr:H110 protein [Eubucco bourcierii]
MSEAFPAAAPAAVPGLAAKAGAKKPTKVVSGSKVRKPVGPSVTELIVKAVSTSEERKGLSLTALKKALAAGGYDVKENNSRIKLGLKSLVGKGTLLQTKGIGASGSFCLSKMPGEVKEKAPKKRVVSAKPRKSVVKKTASKVKKQKNVAIVKKSPKKPKKPAAAAAKKVAKSPNVTKAAKSKKTAAKSPVKAKVVKAKVTKSRVAKPKVAKSKAAAATK